ncbi:GNAT family N-acetyltransferase [Martelella alba]|uniref:GNAT family N-acetyltransferase n=1 Tax=Martelella alba TaxID=2590451 RepID=A0ABY2SMS8_9HYPH|nr:GNAT family N-acetyltransferase [Martelella alba]TKI07166.1 GNAT family N-acetyltransferase [Martelella alba]
MGILSAGDAMTTLLRAASAKEIHSLYARLPEYDTHHGLLELEMRLQHKPHHLLLAEADGCPVGLVAGYALEPALFFNWLGGVLPAYRRRGIGRRLWMAQEEWAATRGYNKITVKVRNRYTGMLLFLIANHYLPAKVDARDDDWKNLTWLAKNL